MMSLKIERLSCHRASLEGYRQSTYLHNEPELVTVPGASRAEEHAVELGDVRVPTKVPQYQKFLFDLLNIVCDVLQDFNSNVLA